MSWKELIVRYMAAIAISFLIGWFVMNPLVDSLEHTILQKHHCQEAAK